MAKKRVRTPKPKRSEHPLIKAAHLQEKLDLLLDRTCRLVKELCKVRQQITYQAREAAKRKAQENTP